MKVPHIKPSTDPQLEQAHGAKCESYQARPKDSHDTRCHAALYDFIALYDFTGLTNWILSSNQQSM